MVATYLASAGGCLKRSNSLAEGDFFWFCPESIINNQNNPIFFLVAAERSETALG
jgi:hypothetical protein